MPVLRNKRRSADDMESLLGNTNWKKRGTIRSLDLEGEENVEQQHMQGSRENEGHIHIRNQDRLNTDINDQGNDEDVFTTANSLNEVADWTAEDEEEIVRFMDYREPRGDLEMGTGPLPSNTRSRHKRPDSPAPPSSTPITGIRRLSPRASTSSGITKRVSFQSDPMAKRPPPPKNTSPSPKTNNVQPDPQGPAPNPTPSTSTPPPKSPAKGADIQQIASLLDSKLKGVARADDVRSVNARLQTVADELAEQREDVDELKQEMVTLRANQVTSEKIIVTVREEIERNDREKKTYANNNTIPPPSTSTELQLTSNDLACNHPSTWSASSGSSSSGFLAGATSKEQEDARRTSFNTCRRSLLIWPIEGKSEREMLMQLHRFLGGALKFRQSEISAMEILRVYRTDLPARTLAHNEIRVIFKTPRGRDTVSMRSKYLGRYMDPQTRLPTAGFRLDIPDYLAQDFRMLEDTGYQLREEYGDELRKYIKYDDLELGLYLEVRFPGEKRWTKITPRIAREIVECGNRDMAEGIKRRMRRRSTERATALGRGGTNERTSTALQFINQRPRLIRSFRPRPLIPQHTQPPQQEPRQRQDSAMSTDEGVPVVNLVSPSVGTPQQPSPTNSSLGASGHGTTWTPDNTRRTTSPSTTITPISATADQDWAPLLRQ